MARGKVPVMTDIEITEHGVTTLLKDNQSCSSPPCALEWSPLTGEKYDPANYRNLKIGATCVKERAFKVLVRPLLEYSSSVWDP